MRIVLSDIFPDLRIEMQRLFDHSGLFEDLDLLHPMPDRFPYVRILQRTNGTFQDFQDESRQLDELGERLVRLAVDRIQRRQEANLFPEQDPLLERNILHFTFEQAMQPNTSSEENRTNRLQSFLSRAYANGKMPDRIFNLFMDVFPDRGDR